MAQQDASRWRTRRAGAGQRLPRRPGCRIVYAIRHAFPVEQPGRGPLRIAVRPVLRVHLGRLMGAAAAFEAGNAAATLLILRAT